MQSTPYTPLNPPSRQIRLLRLLPGDDSDQISCVLETYDLYQPLSFSGSSNSWAYTARERLAPDFTSLSYTWGNPDEDHKILLNGCLVSVRSNLWAFLREIRDWDEYRHRWLWIDALCIDQSNTNERMHQVGRMAHIYRKSKEVLVWLGPASPASDLGIDILSFAEQCHLLGSASCRAKEDKVQAILGLCNRNCKSCPLCLPDPADGLSICTDWTRLWVLQELSNAKDATIICGRKSTLR